MERNKEFKGQNLVISTDVINTVNSLPMDERLAVASALACDLILGQDPTDGLTPVQAMIYSMIRGYVKRDTARAENFAPAASTPQARYQSA